MCPLIHIFSNTFDNNSPKTLEQIGGDWGALFQTCRVSDPAATYLPKHIPVSKQHQSNIFLSWSHDASALRFIICVLSHTQNSWKRLKSTQRIFQFCVCMHGGLKWSSSGNSGEGSRAADGATEPSCLMRSHLWHRVWKDPAFFSSSPSKREQP